jgi:hypothetical protein
MNPTFSATDTNNANSPSFDFICPLSAANKTKDTNANAFISLAPRPMNPTFGTNKAADAASFDITWPTFAAHEARSNSFATNAAPTTHPWI